VALEKGVIMRKIFLLSILVISYLFGENLDFNLCLNKPVYLLGEPIQVSLIFINSGSNPIKIPDLGEPIVYAGVVDIWLTGKQAEASARLMHATLVSPEYWPFKEVSPGDTFVVLYRFVSTIIHYGRFTIEKEPGDYKFYASYKWPRGNKPIYSDTSTCRVIMPEGEDRKAYELYIKARKTKIKDAEGTLGTQKNRFYLEVIEKYPNNIYSELALEDYIIHQLLWYSTTPIDSIFNLTKRLITKYPQNLTNEIRIKHIFAHLIGRYHKHYGHVNEIVEFFERIIEDYPNTIGAKCANHCLSYMQKGVYETNKLYK